MDGVDCLRMVHVLLLLLLLLAIPIESVWDRDYWEPTDDEISRGLVLRAPRYWVSNHHFHTHLLP